MNSLAAQHPLQLVAALGVVERLDPRVGRVAGHLLDPEVRVGDARDLRQVRDREHLRALGEPLQRRGDGVGGLAADARVDLVEDHRLAAADRRDRERDARELAARGRLGDRPERQAGVRADQEDGLVGARRAGIALAQLDAELALAHADAAQLLRDRRGERGRGRLAGRRAARRPARSPASRRQRAPPRQPPPDRGRPRARRAPRAPRRRARAGRRSRPQRKRRRASAIRSSSPSTCSRRSGLGLERGEEARAGRSRPRRRRSSRSRSSSPARASSGASRSSGASARSAAAASPVRALALVGRERLRGAGRSLCELGDVAQPLALVAQLLLAAGLEARRSPRRARAARARRASSAAAPRVSSSCRLRAAASSRQASRASRRRRSCSSPTKRVEDVELVRGPREPPLLELAGHRDQPLGGGGEVLARDGAAPRVRARAAVGEDAPREHEPGLVLGRAARRDRPAPRRRRSPSGTSSSASTYASAPVGADDPGVALRAEQQADRLGEDRLAGARLARDRRQPDVGSQLGLADEHEVLDPQATKQRSGCSG